MAIQVSITPSGRMSEVVVLDAAALLALLNGEPGAAKVADDRGGNRYQGSADPLAAGASARQW